MTPQTQCRRPRNSSRINVLVALVFHAVLVFVVLYYAARSGMIGERLKNLTVSMVKEPPPEKPKEPDKPAPPSPPELTKESVPAAVTIAPPSAPVTAPPVVDLPAVTAPASADLPSFVFSDGAKPVETGTPARLYKNFVEYTLRANWDRPTDVSDINYSVDVEIRVDPSGKITGSSWKKSSGDKRWDDSVRKAIESTRALNRPPPAGFPEEVLVRFDVIESGGGILEQ